MTFSFPLSEQESADVREAVEKAKASFSESSRLAKRAVRVMRENAAAISDEYRKDLMMALSGAESALFQMNMQHVRMKKQQDRIIAPESSKN